MTSITFTIGILILSLCSVIPSHAQEATETREITRVTSSELSELLFFPEYSVPARVESLNHSQLSAQISAKIEQIIPRVGEVVKQGNLLVELDCDDAKLTRSSALSRLQLARKELNRLNKLQQASVATEQSLNAAETDLTQADVLYKQASLQVGRCNIYAPFNGVVTARQASIGELAAPGTALLTLVDLDNLEVVAQISEAQTNSLRLTPQALFVWSNTEYPIALRALPSYVNSNNRNREPRFSFSADRALHGASGRLIWTNAKAHLPADFLSERDGMQGLFILEEEKARFIEIPYATAGHPVEITLPPTTQIIIDGRFGLNDGDAVSPQGL